MRPGGALPAREGLKGGTGGGTLNVRMAILAALLAPAIAVAGSPSPLELVTESQVRGRLVNYKGFFAEGATGLRIVSYELPGLPRATLGVSFRAGSTDDPQGKEGMAHLVEHLVFRARPGGGARIADRMESSGFVFNAETSHDQTLYHATGKLPQLKQVVAIEADRLADPLAGITEKDFLVERDVVISEFREARDHAPVTLQVQWLMEVRLAKDHPYRRPIGGTADDPDTRRAAFREARSVSLRFDGVGRSADALRTLVLEGRPDDYWEHYPARLASLDSARLQAAARSLALGREVVVVSGSAARLRPLLEKAGFKVEVSPEPPPEPPEVTKDAKPDADGGTIDTRDLTGM